MTGCWLRVTRGLLLVLAPPPSSQAMPPRPDSTHANFVCAGPGGGGHWGVLVTGVCCPQYGRWGLDHPAPLGHPSAEGNLDRGSTGAAAISVVKGNLDRGGVG